jgi:RpiR family transcriptional regulator, carbohydrate utilization regulator
MYIPGGGLVRLKESLASLSESEAKIADYVLRHPADIVNLTVQELAQRSGGSPAAVVRLWKSLGFEGYNDFKLRVASDVQSNATGEYTELQLDGSFGSIVQAVEESLNQTIQNTFRLLRETDVETAVHHLVNARRILTFGVGASGMVANDLAQKLLRIGFSVQASSDFHTAATVAAQLGSKDTMVAVSHSGKTSDVVEVAQMASDNGAHIIAITCFGDTPLHRIATTRLCTSAVEPRFRVAATASRISALAIIDTLFIYLANHFDEKIYAPLESSRKAVASHKLERSGDQPSP